MGHRVLSLLGGPPLSFAHTLGANVTAACLLLSSAATSVSTIVLALSDGKFGALVAAATSIINTLLILRIRSHVRKTRDTNKRATDDLLSEVRSHRKKRKRHQ